MAESMMRDYIHEALRRIRDFISLHYKYSCITLSVRHHMGFELGRTNKKSLSSTFFIV